MIWKKNKKGSHYKEINYENMLGYISVRVYNEVWI